MVSAQATQINCDNGCAAKRTCGLPYTVHGLGGGWIIYFAR
jgi:hypothetical protein